jgi:glycine cleavage system H protein
VESVKAVSEVFAPVPGEVVAVNGDLTENPDNAAVVNREPYGAGWMVRIRLAADADLSGLLDAAGYRSYLDQSGD